MPNDKLRNFVETEEWGQIESYLTHEISVSVNRVLAIAGSEENIKEPVVSTTKMAAEKKRIEVLEEMLELPRKLFLDIDEKKSDEEE